MSPHSPDGGPTMIIGGAQKAGTTALFYLLAQHPDVFGSPVKEPNHFSALARESEPRGPGAAAYLKSEIDRRDEYERLFSNARAARHRIEASTTYLTVPGTAEQIRSYDSSMRFVFLLRDPGKRAFSAFSFTRQLRLEPVADFRRALKLEPDRMADGWTPDFAYRGGGRYADLLEPYLDAFPPDQILVLGYEELNDDPLSVLRRVERFAELNPFDDYETGARYNPSGAPRSALLQRLYDLRAPRLRGRLRQLLPESVHRWVVAARERNIAPGPTLDPVLHREINASLEDQISAIADRFGNAVAGGWLRA